MDPIDQRARAARLAVENATAEVTPAPFSPRRSLVAPAVMAAGLLIGGSVLATSVLGDSNDTDQNVATESDMAAAPNDSTAASETALTIPKAEGASAASPEAIEEAAEGEEAAVLEGDFFVLASPPPGLAEPAIFAIPASEMPEGPFELAIDVYGTPGADPFINGDIGIMRADGMGIDSMDGEALTVAGREVLVERNEASGPDSPPGGPSIIVNWIDEESGQAIGVASWTLELDALLPLVEVLLDDSSATPAETDGGLVLISEDQSLGGGLGLLSGVGGQVMYQSDPSTVSGPDGFGMVVVSTDDAGENPEFASSWLFSGTVPKVTELPDGVTVVEMTPEPEAGGGGTISVRVPHPTDDDRVVVVADAGSGAFDRDTMVAAARSIRLATESEVAAMAVASEGLGMGEDFEPSAMIEGVYPDGEHVAVESGPEGFSVLRDGVATPEGTYEFVPQNTTPSEMFVLTAKSDGGDVLVLPFSEPQVDPGSTTALEPVDRVELRLADGSVIIARTFSATGEMVMATGGASGWSSELEEMPAAVVGVAADGADVVSYVLPEIDLEPGRKVTFIGMN